jgi:two-component system LytT family response regulator
MDAFMNGGSLATHGVSGGAERWKEEFDSMHTVVIINADVATRTNLAQCLSDRPDIARVWMAQDLAQVERLMEGTPVDLAIVNLDGADARARDVLAAVSRDRSAVHAFVVVSDNKEHALDAFEHEAADYLVKPVSPERLHRAVDAGLRNTRARRLSTMVSKLPDLQSILAPPPPRIMAKVEGKFVAVNPAEIIFVKAEGNYVLLEGTQGRLLLRESMHEMERKLERYGFLRIHRSIIVNAAFVLEFQPCSTGEYSLTLRSGKKFTVTRTYKKNLRRLASNTIGMDSREPR